MESLQEIGLRVGTSKAKHGDAPPHTYLPVYEALLSHLRDKHFNLCEIGIDRGDSLRMWLEFFPQARIFGIDAGPFESFDARLSTFACNAASPVVEELFPPDFLDVIVDDASHVPEQQKATYYYLWPALKPGGLYFIEDLIGPEQVPYWSGRPEFHSVWGRNVVNGGGWGGDDILVVMKKA